VDQRIKQQLVSILENHNQPRMNPLWSYRRKFSIWATNCKRKSVRCKQIWSHPPGAMYVCIRDFSGMSRLSGKLDNAVRSAQHVVTLASLNKHFYTPQAVSSIFTGRVTDLDTLRRCLEAPAAANQTNAQKRFVVYGLPGSGKTQFCCKFASDNKQRYHQASIQNRATRSS
jgi:hypothetical protein